jgi:hypothetical protein
VPENFRKAALPAKISRVRPPLVPLLLLSATCAPKEPAGEPIANPPPPPQQQAAPRAAQVVNATILVNGCQTFGKTNGKLAERAMYELVEGCSSVPGGSAQFGATLLPNGRIEIAAVAGRPDVVPICILGHSLRHRVPLSQPCRLDVKIEQQSVPVSADSGT